MAVFRPVALIYVTNCPNLLPDSVGNRRNNLAERYWLRSGSGDDGRGRTVTERCDAYRHFAAQCVELARQMDSSYDHTVSLEMTLLWSRFAKHAAKIATPEELPKHIIGRPKTRSCSGEGTFARACRNLHIFLILR